MLIELMWWSSYPDRISRWFEHVNIRTVSYRGWRGADWKNQRTVFPNLSAELRSSNAGRIPGSQARSGRDHWTVSMLKLSTLIPVTKNWNGPVPTLLYSCAIVIILWVEHGLCPWFAGLHVRSCNSEGHEKWQVWNFGSPWSIISSIYSNSMFLGYVDIWHSTSFVNRPMSRKTTTVLKISRALYWINLVRMCK